MDDAAVRELLEAINDFVQAQTAAQFGPDEYERRASAATERTHEALARLTGR